MKYHMLRMLNHEREVTRKLFKNDYIAIGYSDFDRIENWKYIDKYNSVEDKDYLIKEMTEKCNWNCTSRQIGAHKKLNKYFKFNIGDTVIIPDTKTFHIVEIIEDIKSFNSLKNQFIDLNDRHPDIGFVYKVKKIKNDRNDSAISREKFAEAPLVARLKNLSGLLNVDDLSKCIENSKRAFLSNKTLKIEEIIKEKMRNDLVDNLIMGLSADKFEKFLVKIMKKLGATTCDIPSKSDKSNAIEEHADVDLVCIFEKLKHVVYIQAKFHKGESSGWAVEQLDAYNGEADLEYDYTTSYWAVTTGEFKEEAHYKAKEKNIRLIDKYELADLLLDIGVEGL